MTIPNLLNFFWRFVRAKSGATAVEYALIAAVMAGLIVAALALIDLQGVFTTIQNILDNA